MADPLPCLRAAGIVAGIWFIIYSLIQIGVMAWQLKVVKDLQWYWENREIPDSAFIYQDFKARFPGLYGLYTETPERRRVNAMYAIVIICLCLSIAILPFSIAMLYGAIKKRKHFIWPWFFVAGPTIIMSTAFAVLWWSGDVFNAELVFSVGEFVMSVAISGPFYFAVIFFYFRLSGSIRSVKPNKRPDPFGSSQRKKKYRVEYVREEDLPPWRRDYPDRPPPELERRIRRKSRERLERESLRREKEAEKAEKERRIRERERRRQDEETARAYRALTNPNVDYYVPAAVEQTFPWNTPIERPPPIVKPRKRSAAEVIENLYYEHYPEEMPEAIGALRREKH